MNVFNCHVNRSPSSGEIDDIFYKPGKFLNASLDKASEENERNYFKIKDNKTTDGIVVVQIAGLIARRIVTQVHKKQTVIQGQRIGMIRFGSRVDIYLQPKKNHGKSWTKCYSRRKFNSKFLNGKKNKFKVVSVNKSRYILPSIINFNRSLFRYKLN